MFCFRNSGLLGVVLSTYLQPTSCFLSSVLYLPLFSHLVDSSVPNSCYKNTERLQVLSLNANFLGMPSLTSKKHSIPLVNTMELVVTDLTLIAPVILQLVYFICLDLPISPPGGKCIRSFLFSSQYLWQYLVHKDSKFWIRQPRPVSSNSQAQFVSKMRNQSRKSQLVFLFLIKQNRKWNTSLIVKMSTVLWNPYFITYVYNYWLIIPNTFFVRLYIFLSLNATNVDDPICRLQGFTF